MAFIQLLLLATFSFCDSHAVSSLRFLITGDMGGVDTPPYTTECETNTAREMGLVADRLAPQYVVQLGDNFYFHGVTSLSDPRFKETFEDVYTADSLQVSWYLIAGNHDHYGNVSAQIQYSFLSERWNFPYYYYYREFKIPDTQKTVGFVFIDTVLLCGNTGYDDEGAQPRGPENLRLASDQWDFIENALKFSEANYLFVAGHFPVWSIAEHGPTQCLVKKLQPMLDKYRVSGYLCGHDHNLQHLQVQSSHGAPIDYYLSGMANFVNRSTMHRYSVPRNSLKFHYAGGNANGGFLYAEATGTNITLTFINAKGEHLYSNVIHPRQK